MNSAFSSYSNSLRVLTFRHPRDERRQLERWYSADSVANASLMARVADELAVTVTVTVAVVLSIVSAVEAIEAGFDTENSGAFA